MTAHCSPEDLALAALGEQLPAEQHAHLADCPSCAEEVRSLRRSVDVLAVPALASPSEGAGVTPPPEVWAAIAAATGIGDTPAGATPAPAAPPVVVPTPISGIDHRRPRAFRPSRALLAAAATLVIGVGAGVAGTALLDGDDGPDPALRIAAADLQPLPGQDGAGSAVIREASDGTRVLEIDLRAPVPTDDYYEVWLLDRAVQHLVAVGVAHAGHEELPLPGGLDLDQYALVDVSIEPLDGDPAHSSVSLVRGELTR